MKTNNLLPEMRKIEEISGEELQSTASGSAVRVGNVPKSTISRINTWPAYKAVSNKKLLFREEWKIESCALNLTDKQRRDNAIKEIFAQYHQFNKKLEAIKVLLSPDERASQLLRLSSQFPLFKCTHNVSEYFGRMHIELVEQFTGVAQPLYSKFPFLKDLGNHVASLENYITMLVLETLNAKTCFILSSRYGIGREHHFRETLEKDFIDNYLKEECSNSCEKINEISRHYKIITDDGKAYLFTKLI